MSEPTLTLAIAHINDTHSHFEPTPLSLAIPPLTSRFFAYVGGFARIATVAQQFKATTDADGFLFLHAGDCFQGSLYYSLYKGEANACLLNALKLDAMALGNHELDLGNHALARFIDQIQFPLLAGNWDLSQENQHKPHRLQGRKNLYSYDSEQQIAQVLIKNIADKKVAIFGVSLDKMAEIAMPDNDTPFINSRTVIKNTIAFIHAQHQTPYIILLSHLGLEQDLKVAAELDGLSMIVGGHSHVLQGDFSNVGLGDMGEYGRLINHTLVVQAGCHALAIGKYNVSFDRHGRVCNFNGGNYLMLGRSLVLDSHGEQPMSKRDIIDVKRYLSMQPNIIHCRGEEKIKAIIANDYKPQVEKLKHDIVCVIPTPLRHVRIPDQQGASDIAPLVCEAMLHSASIRNIALDFAIHNAGGVRVNIEQGKLTAAEIAGRLLPFAIDLMHYQLTGMQLRQALEGAINNALNNGVDGTGDGSFPYTAKLKYTYDYQKPKGERITELMYLSGDKQWVDIKPNKKYTSISSAYTSKGKEGYNAFKSLATPPLSLDVILSQSFIEYARTKQRLIAPDLCLIKLINLPN